VKILPNDSMNLTLEGAERNYASRMRASFEDLCFPLANGSTIISTKSF
jgi:hypothetical protein